jgi:MFS family permease
MVNESRGLPALSNAFRSLAGRDFRLYFLGQCVSLIGMWARQVAFAWVVYRLTGSAFMLGLVIFIWQFPTLILSPFSPLLADRFSRRGVLVVILVLQMAVGAALAILAWHGDIATWMLVAASLALGLTNAVEAPVRQAFIPDIVPDRALVPNAIALVAVSVNVARLAGPATAGAILAVFGEAACFAVNAICYIAPIAALLVIHPAPAAEGEEGISLAAGYRYARRFAPARWLLVSVIVTSCCLSPYLTFLPVYAKDILKAGPDTLGMLVAAFGGGALAAALYLANRKSVVGLGNRSVAGAFAVAIASVAFAYNSVLWAAYPLLIVAGCGLFIMMTASNMLLQALVPDPLRGQVMALYSMSFVGMLPVASLAAGGIAHYAGVQPVFLVAGLAFAVLGFSLQRKLPELRRDAHPVLQEKGLLHP